VEVHLIEGNIVDGGFGVAQELERAKSECASLGQQRRGLQDGADGRQVAAMLVRMSGSVYVVMRVRMIVIMIVGVGMVVRCVVAAVIVRRVGIVAADEHARFAGADAAAVYRIEDEGCAEIECGGGLLKKRNGDAGVDQGAEEHVTTEAGEAFEIANAHGYFL
jgi:hypothetical protein